MTLGLADLAALADDDLGIADDGPTAVGPEPTRDTERIRLDELPVGYGATSPVEPGGDLAPDERISASPDDSRVVAKPPEPLVYPRRWRRW